MSQKNNAAMDAAREIQSSVIASMMLGESIGDSTKDIAAIIARHMATRDMAVAEAVRAAVMDSACLEEFGCADTDGRYPYRIHWETVDLAPIIASVTNRDPERCVWTPTKTPTWDGAVLYKQSCCDTIRYVHEGKPSGTCGCGREIEVKKEADDDQ